MRCHNPRPDHSTSANRRSPPSPSTSRSANSPPYRSWYNCLCYQRSPHQLASKRSHLRQNRVLYRCARGTSNSSGRSRPRHISPNTSWCHRGSLTWRIFRRCTTPVNPSCYRWNSGPAYGFRNSGRRRRAWTHSSRRIQTQKGFFIHRLNNRNWASNNAIISCYQNSGIRSHTPQVSDITSSVRALHLRLCAFWKANRCF